MSHIAVPTVPSTPIRTSPVTGWCSQGHQGVYKEVSRGINKSVHPHWWVTEMCGNQKALTYNILCIHQNQSKNFQISTSNSSISQVAFNSILDFLLRFGLFPNLRNKVKIMMMVFAYQRVSGFFCPPRGGQTVNQKTRSPAMYKPKNLSPGHVRKKTGHLKKLFELTGWYRSFIQGY